MAQVTEFNSFNDLWREARRWNISGATGSTATTCFIAAQDLATALSAKSGFSISISGTAAQQSNCSAFQSFPTVA
jgi:TRAP-type uncharacterized transport system substrate-binding protein